MESAGIDVSKDSLDVHCPGEGHLRLPHSQGGMKDVVAALKRARVTVVAMEASGGIEARLAEVLHAAGFEVYVLNPRRVRQFAESIGHLEKTDRVDAQVLAHFGTVAVDKYPAWEPTSPAIAELRSLVVRRRQLSQMRADEARRRRSPNIPGHPSFEDTRTFLTKQIERIDAEIAAHSEHEDIKETSERLRTVPGVGAVLAATLVALLPELGRVKSKQIAKLVGVAPMANDSGKSQKRRKVREGRAEIRQVLYMATLSACRDNPAIRQFKQRLLERGKPKKVANVACMNKLLRILNAMQTEKIEWQQTKAAAA